MSPKLTCRLNYRYRSKYHLNFHLNFQVYSLEHLNFQLVIWDPNSNMGFNSKYWYVGCSNMRLNTLNKLAWNKCSSPKSICGPPKYAAHFHMLASIRLCGITFAYSHLLAYCLLCGDMSVNPLLLITHCQDENRQLISFWNEYSWRSVLSGICC